MPLFSLDYFHFAIFCPVLPLNELDQLLLLPVLVLHLMEFVPDLVIDYFDGRYLFLELIQSLLFALFPVLILFVMLLLLLIAFGLVV